jgi:hypothetical protein
MVRRPARWTLRDEDTSRPVIGSRADRPALTAVEASAFARWPFRSMRPSWAVRSPMQMSGGAWVGPLGLPAGARSAPPFRRDGSAGLVFPRLPEEPDPISRKDVLYVRCRIASPLEDPGQSLQIGNRVEVSRSLLLPIGTIQIAPNAAMARGACDLRDVVEVIRHHLQRHMGNLIACR